MSSAAFKVAGSSIDDTSMPDLELGGSQIPQVVQAGASKEKLARALLILSYASLFVGVKAGIHLPTATGFVFAHPAAYYSAVAALLAAVLVEMGTAIWLPRSHGQRLHTFAEVLHGAGVVLLIVVSTVGGLEFTVAKA